MFSSVAMAKAGSWIMSKLTFKNITNFIILCLMLFGAYKTYNWVWERGATSSAEAHKTEIDKITGERDEAKADYAAYKATYLKWVEDGRKARELIAAENKANIEDLEAQLAAAEKRAGSKKEIIREVPKLIPVSADTQLPVGFVSLWNQSLEGGSASPDAAALAGLPSGTQGAEGLPSGITLSQFSVVAVENNIEAVRRGVIIRSWQTWYDREKATFTKAQQDAAAQIPTLSADGKGDGRAPQQ